MGLILDMAESDIWWIRYAPILIGVLAILVFSFALLINLGVIQ